jgi:hypothetical protein
MLTKATLGRNFILSALTILLSLTILSTSEPVLMTEDVGALIFQERTFHLIQINTFSSTFMTKLLLKSFKLSMNTVRKEAIVPS